MSASQGFGAGPAHASPESLPPLQPGSQPPGPAPKIVSHVSDGRRYELRVEQEPKRARMCGFGDKDRRPITPPPCVRLIITDAITRKEVDCNEIDHGMFVLNVDLWDEVGQRQVNLVKHTQTASYSQPSPYQDISQAPAYSPLSGPPSSGYPHIPDPNYQQSYSPYQQQGPPQIQYGQSQPQQSGPPALYSPPDQYQQQPRGYAPPPSSVQYPPYQSGPPQPVYITTGAMIHSMPAAVPPPGMSAYNPGQGYSRLPDQYPQQPRNSVSQSPPSGMFTRNLIGSLSASAFRLTDQNDFIGIWFVLQDLSVRTEGIFRLRFSFVNVGGAPPVVKPGTTPQLPPGASMVPINTGRAPVLASCFSQPFQVYSAKKFPGVVESTQLSKMFASQGIKIPIRKDGVKDGKNRDE
ncbi:velvet factor [Bisporella sp. PMI_857]|nr:velvet factor [Bisporella sp. PMI_857]